MKRPTRPRPLARRTLPSRVPRTVGDRGARALRAAPRLRGIGSLAVSPETVAAIPLPAAIIPNAVLPIVPVIPALPPIPIAASPVARPNRDAMAMRGEYWEIRYQQHHGVIADCRGLRYLALLVRDTAGGGKPIHAKELTARAKRLEAEYEQIADELSRAGAKRSATRRKAAFVHDGEKAGKAVAKAIAEAIARIADHPDLSSLAEHFTANVRKGHWLSYTGGADWHIDFTAPPSRK